MVYRDISQSKSEENILENRFHFQPSLLDRFFSFLIDYLIFSPFVSFFLFIFFKDMIRYLQAFPFAPEQISITIFLAITSVFLFAILQSVFIVLYSATPGQYFLKMKIVFQAQKEFFFFRVLIRQTSFWLSICFLGLPWLALLTDSQQKTFYDKISDSQIFSKKNNSYYFGFEHERNFWQAFSGALMIFLGLIFSAFFYNRYQSISNRVESVKAMQKNNYFCEEVGQVSELSRLQFAIAMNLVGQVSDQCLDKEADFVLWKMITKETDLAYFAKYLTEKDPKLQLEYLRASCMNPSVGLGCDLAKAFKTADFESFYNKIKIQNQVLSKVLAYEFSRILNKKEDISKKFSELQVFDSHKTIKKYLLTEIITQKQLKENVRVPASDSANKENTFDEDFEKALNYVEDL